MKILSACFANADKTAVVAQTAEAGAVVISKDKPEQWAELIASKVKIAPYAPPELPQPTRLAKAELWRRCSDREVEALAFALSQAPLRLQMIFRDCDYLDTTDADYPALRGGIAAALGDDRAAEVLQPTY